MSSIPSTIEIPVDLVADVRRSAVQIVRRAAELYEQALDRYLSGTDGIDYCRERRNWLDEALAFVDVIGDEFNSTATGPITLDRQQWWTGVHDSANDAADYLRETLTAGMQATDLVTTGRKIESLEILLIDATRSEEVTA